MKIKVISRSEEEQTKESTGELRKQHRNLDPTLHPLERPREYIRALNSTKLDKLFAKPFVGSLSGHTDGIFTLTRHTNQLNCVGSGSCDGVIKLWNLSNFTERTTIQAHDGYVRGLVFANPLASTSISPQSTKSKLSEGSMVISCGEDKTIKFWKLELPEYTHASEDKLPVQIYNGKNAFTSIDHQRFSQTFATSSSQYVEIWNQNRSTPEQTLTWGHGSISKVKFNPIETNLLASCTSDRSVIFYDIRENSPSQKITTAMRSNSIAWNPMESFTIALANEDENLYQYDIRNLDKAYSIHRDHVGAILDVDYSPTGKEMVTGSYDKTIRIFPCYEKYTSREVYHTNRMQRIFSVLFTGDSKFLLSGSDDMNIRVWKARSSEVIGIQSYKQREKKNYHEKIKEKFKEIPELKTIANHQRVPKEIYKKRFIKNEIYKAKNRKIENQAKYTGKVPKTPNSLTSHTVIVDK